MEGCHLSINNLFRSLNKAGRCDHLINLESLDCQYILLLDCINDSFSSAWFSWLESLTKLELSVVHKSQRARVILLLGHLLHELNTDIEIWEDK